jgi:hypothetical protein
MISGSMPSDKRGQCTKAQEPEFHLFPKLPLEIRTMIWALALEPRIFHLSLDLIVAQSACLGNGVPTSQPSLYERETRSETIKTIRRDNQPFHNKLVSTLDIPGVMAGVGALHSTTAQI